MISQPHKWNAHHSIKWICHPFSREPLYDDNDYTDKWSRMWCALYRWTSIYYTNIIRTKGTKMLFYVQNRVATVPSRWLRNRRRYSTANSLCSYLCHTVLSRSFKPRFRNASMAQWARLHIGPGIDRRIDSQSITYTFFTIFCNIFCNTTTNILQYAACSVFATQWRLLRYCDLFSVRPYNTEFCSAVRPYNIHKVCGVRSYNAGLIWQS